MRAVVYLWFVFALVACCAATKKLSQCKKVCVLDDLGCVTKGAVTQYKTIIAGINGLIEPMDPLYIPNIDGENNSTTHSLTNIVLRGLQGCSVKKLRLNASEEKYWHYIHCPKLTAYFQNEDNGTSCLLSDKKIVVTASKYDILNIGEYGVFVENGDHMPHFFIQSVQTEVSPKGKLTYDINDLSDKSCGEEPTNTKKNKDKETKKAKDEGQSKKDKIDKKSKKDKDDDELKKEKDKDDKDSKKDTDDENLKKDKDDEKPKKEKDDEKDKKDIDDEKLKKDKHDEKPKTDHDDEKLTKDKDDEKDKTCEDDEKSKQGKEDEDSKKDEKKENEEAEKSQKDEKVKNDEEVKKVDKSMKDEKAKKDKEEDKSKKDEKSKRDKEEDKSKKDEKAKKDKEEHKSKKDEKIKKDKEDKDEKESKKSKKDKKTIKDDDLDDCQKKTAEYLLSLIVKKAMIMLLNSVDVYNKHFLMGEVFPG